MNGSTCPVCERCIVEVDGSDTPVHLTYDDVREFILKWPREKQLELYRWMNAVLGCRI